jgi:hypothetical protein
MLKSLFLFQALVDIAFGIPLIFATSTVLALYGLSTDRTGTYLGQFVGATFVILAWIAWFARDWPDEQPRQVVVRGGFIGSLIGLGASLSFQLGPSSTTSTWLFVALTAIFTVGWGYYSYETMRRPATRQLTA